MFDRLLLKLGALVSRKADAPVFLPSEVKKVSEYRPLEFPKAKYHALLPPVLVNNREEDLALGEDWHDHPDFVEPVKPKLVIHEVKKPKP